MKTTLLGLAAKFIHPSMAIYTLSSYCQTQGIENISLLDLTINHNLDFVVAEIYRENPDILGISCYIWNIDMVSKILAILRETKPNMKIILGGPEIDAELPNADYFVIGEGEEVLVQLIKDIMAGREDIPTVYSSEVKLPLGLNPFIHDTFPLEMFDNKILYYETSRSCPYSCSYCLYGNDNSLLFLDLERVKKELKFYLDRGVKQVKFLDRSFNARRSHAMEIWQFLIDNDNGVTNFHFEIYPDLLSEELFEVLNTVRPGQFQFEIGVQSTNRETLKLVKRRTNLDRAIANIKKIPRSIHVHLDLIAGLPGEGYASFRNSFNDVYALKPEMLQLGFLKVLKNTSLDKETEQYGIVYNKFAPFTTLYTNDITYDEMMKLRSVERVLNLYYNTEGYFKEKLERCEALFDTPFDFYENLAVYYEGRKWHWASHKKVTLDGFLDEYLADVHGVAVRIEE